MSSLPEPPAGLDLNETKVPALVSGFVLTWVFGAITVGLRIAARRLVGNPLWWDDWFIVTSLVRSIFTRDPNSIYRFEPWLTRYYRYSPLGLCLT
jgi:hypothetical protein